MLGKWMLDTSRHGRRLQNVLFNSMSMSVRDLEAGSRRQCDTKQLVREVLKDLDQSARKSYVYLGGCISQFWQHLDELQKFCWYLGELSSIH